ncbi:MAG: putative lipid II flippase FtsW [Mariprofundaceae bacterium]|nr:putative lipid II flippase FtsW [Mariprofundaceae bacterium]
MKSSLDPVLLGCVAMLLSLSILMVSSASLSVSEVRYHDAFRIISHWLIYIPIGLLLMWGVSYISMSYWQRYCILLLLLSFLMMAIVLLMGNHLNGATRWFSLFGFSAQPVELLKPAIILYMAYYMSCFSERLQHFAKGMGPMLAILSIAVLLMMMQPDFGNTVLLCTTCFLMWFVGAVPIRHLLGIFLLGIGLGTVAVVVEPYRFERLLSFTNPWDDPFDTGYQLIQSMVAFGSGGIWGAGLGQGVQKLFYLPEAFTDFIAAVLGEELGLMGSLLILSVFATLIGRGIYIATRCEHAFERLLALGATLLMGLSFYINFAAVTGMIPTKGMPIPFFSYGGSALLGNCVLMGFLLAISRNLPAKHISPMNQKTRKEAI